MKNVWIVKIALIGADSPVRKLFDTKQAADDFYRDNDYVDKPRLVKLTDKEYADLVYEGKIN